MPVQWAEDERVRALLAAQANAEALVGEAQARGLIVPGVTESAMNNPLRDLANELYGVRKYWHRRLVRSGPNTLAPHEGNPPDRVVQDDDIVIVDLGPIFDGWEADIGRTIVFGEDPAKLRIQSDAARIWQSCRDYFRANRDITAAAFSHHVVNAIELEGYAHGLGFVGYLVGEFPHDAIAFPGHGATSDQLACYIAPQNSAPFDRHDTSGRTCHWILEVFLHDTANGYADFQEQLLDI